VSRIQTRFEALRSRGEKALIAFVTAGDPSLEISREIVLAIAAAGADLIELGVPFSDPVAEGPVIQRASERAIAKGASLARILELVGSLRAEVEVPLLLMGYANPFLHMGVERFVSAAADAGVDGLIIPDLPPEEGREFFAAAAAKGIDGVLLAAPTTRPERLKKLIEQTRGFLYYVSLTGVTGTRDALASGLEERVQAIRALSSTPVCVGFGISTAEQVATVGAYADGVVVGSALVRAIEQAGPERAARAAGELVVQLKKPLRGRCG